METIFTVVSSKGQVVIPAALGDQIGIKAGTRVAIQREENHLVLQPITEEFIDSLVGCCKGEDSLVEARERDHRWGGEKERFCGFRGPDAYSAIRRTCASPADEAPYARSGC